MLNRRRKTANTFPVCSAAFRQMLTLLDLQRIETKGFAEPKMRH